MTDGNRWLQLKESKPDHAQWYIERFRTMADPATHGTVLAQLRQHLAPGGRLVVGVGAEREDSFDEFFADVASAGLDVDVRLATWDVRPDDPDADFLVAVLSQP